MISTIFYSNIDVAIISSQTLYRYALVNLLESKTVVQSSHLQMM